MPHPLQSLERHENLVLFHEFSYVFHNLILQDLLYGSTSNIGAAKL
jgi:hypothetical protein